MSNNEIIIRECHAPREFDMCVELQKKVWQFDDVDVIPKRMFVVATKIGGQVLGAFDGEEMVGFTLAIPGSKDGNSYLHSHMLAVKESHRNSGLGRKLKLAQRELAIVAGYDLMEWTFDPLEIKNAYLNIAKLGAIARRYLPNHYGDSSSPLQGGLPTDRLVAEWWLNSKRVTDLLIKGKFEFPAQSLAIKVPAQVYEWKSNKATRTKAEEVQMNNRELFLDLLAKGMSVVGYEKSDAGDGIFLLGKLADGQIG